MDNQYPLWLSTHITYIWVDLSTVWYCDTVVFAREVKVLGEINLLSNKKEFVSDILDGRWTRAIGAPLAGFSSSKAPLPYIHPFDLFYTSVLSGSSSEALRGLVNSFKSYCLFSK